MLIDLIFGEIIENSNILHVLCSIDLVTEFGIGWIEIPFNLKLKHKAKDY